MARRALVTILAGAALLVSAPDARAGCNSRACEVRVARHRCEHGEWRGCVLRAALHRGQPYRDLVRVSWCESRWNRFATNGQYVGPFQFGPGTWASTPYGAYPRTSWKWSSLGAAWMWSVGRRGEWSCR